MHGRFADYRYSWKTEGVKNFYGMSFANRIGQVVVPDQNHYGHNGLSETADAGSKLALPGGIRIPVFVDIASENRQVHAVLQGVINSQMCRAGEVE
jgi:hypothetical protein